MAPPLLKDAEAFEFLTELGERLELFGELLSWQDEIQTGVVEHRLVKRNGALHQHVGTPPRRFIFSCLLLGPDVRTRYNQIVDAVRLSPFGSLIHVRFGFTAAVCEGISSKETPGEAIDTIPFTIKFVEDELRELPAPSPAASVTAAWESALQLVALVASYKASAQRLAQDVATKVSAFAEAVAQLSAGAGTVPELLEGLRAVRTATEATAALSADVAQYPIRASSALVFARTLEAFNAVRAGLPSVLSYRVPGRTSVAALAARLYGGRFARAQAEIIQTLNRIQRPYDLSAGTVLLLYDPRTVRSVV